MSLTLSQIVKRHFPAPHAETIRGILAETPLPRGRLVMHSFETKERVEIFVGNGNGNGNGNGHGSSPLEIGTQVKLEDLAFVGRDLEEELGLLPDSWKAAEEPRIQPANYSLFGINTGQSIALFLAAKDRAEELAKVPGLRQVPDFLTYRLFADRRDDTDFVTRLFSRAYLDRQVGNFYRTGLQDNYHLLVGDLDHFKSLNERFGYDAGNLGLRIMGEEIMRALGKDGFGSRRRYGDETASLAIKELLDEYPGGPLAWSNDLNSRLAERSSELPGQFLLRLTFGGYAFTQGDNYSDAKKRADQALIYAKTHGTPFVLWRADLPTHEEMQSGRHLRYTDPELVQFGTAAKRSFPDGIRPDQAPGARDILEDIIHKSPPMREAGNQEVLARLAQHLIIANPAAVQHLTPERVFESIYLTRQRLGLVSEQEKALGGDRLAMYEHMSERFNLLALLTSDEHQAEYNKGLADFGIGCRFDDRVESITATSESQQQSRFIISGDRTPERGEIRSLGEILHLLTTNYAFQRGTGIVTFSREDKKHHDVTIHFDSDRFDVAPVVKLLAEQPARATNYLGLDPCVRVLAHDQHGQTTYYDFETDAPELIEPLLWFGDEKDPLFGKKGIARAHLFQADQGKYGVHVPHTQELLSERMMHDDEYAARILGEEAPRTRWKDGSSTRIRRHPETLASAVQLIVSHYGPRGIVSRGNLPIFHGPKDAVMQVIADLYIPNDIYLTHDNSGTIRVRNLRIPDLETGSPDSSEIATHFARTFNRLLERPGKLTYRIEQAEAKLAHTPQFVGLAQLTLPISTRYGELFTRYSPDTE